jgi:hypothetical protein
MGAGTYQDPGSVSAERRCEPERGTAPDARERGYLGVRATNPLRIERQLASAAVLGRQADGEGLDGLTGEGGIPLSCQTWEQIRGLWGERHGQTQAREVKKTMREKSRRWRSFSAGEGSSVPARHLSRGRVRRVGLNCRAERTLTVRSTRDWPKGPEPAAFLRRTLLR